MIYENSKFYNYETLIGWNVVNAHETTCGSNQYAIATQKKQANYVPLIKL